MTPEYRVIHPTTRAEWFRSDDGLVRKNLVGFDGDQPKPGVRACLFSMYNQEYDVLAAIAEPNWIAYCQKHGYALRTYPGAFHLDPSRPETYGDKVKHSLYYDLRGLFDVVMFLDIDSLFVNMDTAIPFGEYERFLWTFAEGGPMSGLMIARTDATTETHLRYAYELAARENNVRHGVVEPNGISDQDAMTRLMNVPPFSETFRHCAPAESVGFCYPEDADKNPWIVTCRGGSIDEKLATMRSLSNDAVPAHAPTHAVAAYDPRASFDRNWVGPADMKPRVYRTQSEKDTWYAVAVENEYDVPDTFGADDVVVDIGAHIGSFCYRAYRAGSRSIYGFEIDPWHMEAAVANLADLRDGVGLYHKAVVRGDAHRAATYRYDGAWNSFGQLGPEVSSTSLDELLDEIGEPVRFLKIDCEGGEYPILYTCTKLDRITEIAGEYHNLDASPPELRNLPYATNGEALGAFLREQGFRVIVKPSNDTTGNFHALRSKVQSGPPFAQGDPGAGVFYAKLS